MQYLLLIYGDESQWDALSDDDRNGIYREYGQFGADLREQSRFLGGEQLQPVATATTVQVRDGDTLVSDGPFAETKETLGGFYLVEAESLDEAIEWAARIPSARQGTIEVRPVVTRSERGQ
jgi:hypothetical protein